MYCDKNNFIFVHIPKTGGSTIELLLKPYVSDKIQMIQRHEKEMAWEDDIELHITQRGTPHTKHWTLSEHIKNCALVDHVDELFKFTVVRNPYERMLKLYLFKLQNGEFKPLPGEPGEKESRTQYRGRHITDAILGNWRHHMFTEFLEGTRNVRLMGLRTWLGQYQMCTYNDQYAIDYVLRYENFENDVKELFTKLDLPVPEAVPITNSTRPLDQETIKKYYNEQNRKIVETRYKRDFEEFGYEIWP